MGKEVGEFEIVDEKIPKLGNSGFLPFKYYSADTPEKEIKSVIESNLKKDKSPKKDQEKENAPVDPHPFVVSRRLFKDFENNGYILIKNCIPPEVIQKFRHLTHNELNNSSILKSCNATIDVDTGKVRKRKNENFTTDSSLESSSTSKNENSDSDDSDIMEDEKPKSRNKAINEHNESEVTLEIDANTDTTAKSTKNTISSLGSSKGSNNTSSQWQIRFPTKLTWTIDINAKASYDSKGYPGNKEASNLWKRIITSKEYKDIVEHPVSFFVEFVSIFVAKVNV